ncbi:LysR family transcriptional regulator [Sulfitobacter sp. HNIBRBA3233]|uniref:LysR family transcriptional regulator n=1 Tax=Sulfitobacter marinivivus TaxID=3158558 RepID=UPI0032DEA46A
MENWDEVRTAFQVARLGTVSGAAEQLGVHHATVIRHIDALEGRLGIKLFQRHARGYTPTEAGRDLLRVAQATDDQFSQLLSRIKGQGSGVSGDLVITSLVSLGPQLAPLMVDFQSQYPDLVVRYLTGDRLFRLEYGEAHVAIRAGAAPEQPDNVVQHLIEAPMALFAAQSYVDAHGMPADAADLVNHRFVASDDASSRAPFEKWLAGAIPRANVVFRSNDSHVLEDAVRAGAGLGFLPENRGRTTPGLIEVVPSRPEWTTPLWLVTHVDLHRTTKVQALVKFLKTHVVAGTF